MIRTKISLIAVIFVLVLSSCLKPEEYPLEPIIEFERFVATGDIGDLVISFTDGDGDIGLQESDTTGDFRSDNFFHHNLFVEYYEKDDALGWVKGKTLAGDDIEFLYRIPYLTPSGKNKALKGEINVKIEPIYYNPFSTESDTIKYRITLADRSLNVSNVVESSTIIR
ncbi:MAG: hypothetical protein ABF258_05840 [Flavobacteriales bacterium]